MAEEKNPCGCGSDELVSGEVIIDNQQVLAPGCDRVVSQEVCVEASVTVVPTVRAGTPVVNCVGTPSLLRCRERNYTPSTSGQCTFNVSQVLCVNIPIHFDARATAVRGAVACGLPSTEPNCPDIPSTGCTLSQGQFGNNETLTTQLIDSAPNNQIVLGIDSLGFSFTVATFADANLVFTNNVPSPPRPNPQPPVPQYNNLYIQLLAANLNVLNGATCAFAEAAITAANTFLASGVINGPMASTLQEQLAQFNEGNAIGCPGHC